VDLTVQPGTIIPTVLLTDKGPGLDFLLLILFANATLIKIVTTAIFHAWFNGVVQHANLSVKEIADSIVKKLPSVTIATL